MSAFSVVSVCDSQKSDPFHFHTHNYAEIIYVKSGKVVFEKDGRKIEASAGDLLIVGRMESHGTHVIEEPYHRLCVNISYDASADTDRDHRLLSVIQNVRPPRDFIQAKKVETDRIDRIMAEIIAEFMRNSACKEEMLASLTQQLLVRLYRDLPELEFKDRRHINEKMLIIQEYIDNSFTEHITVEGIAAENYISADYFTKCFRETTGYTPKQYLTVSRLAYARKLLLSTDMTVESVAYKSGFSDVNNFIRSFKKYYGDTPGRFCRTSK